MITDLVLSSFFREIKLKTCEFSYLEHEIYDPTLSFDGRFKTELLEIDIFKREGQWVGLIFNRDYLSRNVPQQRQFAPLDRSGLIDSCNNSYKLRYASCNINFMFVSNSLTELGNLEEALLLNVPDNFEYETGLPILDMVHIQANAVSPNGLEKLPKEQYGTLCTLAYSAELTFPVIAGDGLKALIHDPKYEVNFIVT